MSILQNMKVLFTRQSHIVFSLGKKKHFYGSILSGLLGFPNLCWESGGQCMEGGETRRRRRGVEEEERQYRGGSVAEASLDNQDIIKELRVGQCWVAGIVGGGGPN